MPAENKSEAKMSIGEADKITLTHHGPTVAPKYNRGYTIGVTPGELVVVIKSYSKVLLSCKRPFTPEEFDKVLDSFKDLKEADEPTEDDTTVGGGFDAIAFYKNGKEIFKRNDSGKKAKNYSGASISLSSLVPDLAELIESTTKAE
ncbi:MAG TPA: hypothetical protein VM884_05365 [Flavisolibacter sp.]|nr:hypothetical protein [Flavisolibacter sp.]